MDKILKDTLKLLNLSAKEIVFFEACFMLGSTTITEVAKKARLERSTAYLIANDLLQKGLLQEDFSTYRKRITTIPPKKLLVMLAARQRLLQRQEMEFEEHLSELDALYKEAEVRPTVRFYQGVNGLKAVWKDILSTKQELLLWTNQEKETKIFTREFHDRFIQERIKKGIPLRALVVHNPQGEKLLTTDKASLRETKLLPEATSFTAETYIYDNKIATLDYKKDIIGIIIESEPISSAQRAIFEMTWNNLPNQ